MMLLLPCSVSARTFHKATADDLKDGDEVVIATAESQKEGLSGIFALANYQNNGQFSDFNITSMVKEGVLTIDDSNSPAVFKIMGGDPVTSSSGKTYKTFAFYYLGNPSSDINNSSKGWLYRNDTSNSNIYNIKLLDEDAPNNFATVLYSDTYKGYLIKFEDNINYCLWYKPSYFSISKNGGNISFDFYVADPEPDPEPAPTLTFAIDGTEVDATAESIPDVPIGSKLTVNCSNPDAKLYYINSTLPEQEQVEMEYNSSIDINTPGSVTYTIIAKVDNQEVASRSITIITANVDPEPDVTTLKIYIDGKEVNANDTSITDVELGSELTVDCSNTEALLWYTNSAFPENDKMRYDSPIIINTSGLVTYTIIAEVADVEVARRSITIRTADVDPESTVVSFADNPFGMKEGLSGTDYEKQDIVYEKNNIRFSFDKNQKIRLEKDTEIAGSWVLMMGNNHPQIAISTKDTNIRLTRIAVKTLGEVSLGIFTTQQIDIASGGEEPQPEPANLPRRAAENDVKLGELTGNGDLVWNYEGNVDLHNIIIRNMKDIDTTMEYPARIKTIEVGTAQYTATSIDMLSSDYAEPEYYDLNGRKLREPNGKGIYIIRDKRSGHATKMVIR